MPADKHGKLRARPAARGNRKPKKKAPPPPPGSPHLPPINPLEARIGYKFRNSLLLAEALTHPSLSKERRSFLFDNQRMEFLGDAVIQLVITDHLFRLFPDSDEGTLTKLRTRMVSRQALRQQAANLNLGEFLMMGKGEEASGGRSRDSNLADAFEALIGAIYLDGGYEAARRFLLVESEAEFLKLREDPADVNPKGRLQEVLQSIHPAAPFYEMVGESGPEHSRRFICRVMWMGRELGHGAGFSKKEAEVAAAAFSLQNRTWELPAEAALSAVAAENI